MKKYILIFILFFNTILLFSQNDSVGNSQASRDFYIEDLSSKINLTLFTYNATNSIVFDSKGKIDYQPNENVGFGIKIQHKWLGLAYVWAPTGLQEKTKGTTKYHNFSISSCGKRIGFDFYYLFYDGYYIANTNKFPELIRPRQQYVIREDLSTTSIGSNMYYIFNHKKYSYRSTFFQNEIQKHSAGSFIINTSLSYYNISADSSIVPRNIFIKTDPDARIRKGDFYSICLMPAYAHTFVIKEHFFITASLFYGINFQQQHYFVDSITSGFNKFIIAPKGSTRLGLGYNGKKNYAGVSAIVDNYSLPLGSGEHLNYLMGSVSFYFGIRLNLPKSLHKISAAMDKLPNILLQKIN